MPLKVETQRSLALSGLSAISERASKLLNMPSLVDNMPLSVDGQKSVDSMWARCDA